jgi:hypothetical protein
MGVVETMDPFECPPTDQIKRFLAELHYPDNRPSLDSDDGML